MVYVGAASGGVFKTEDGGVTWKAALRQRGGLFHRRPRPRAREPRSPLCGHGRVEPPQQRFLRKRRLQVDGRRRELPAPRARGHAAHLPHRHRPEKPRAGLRRRLRARLRSEPRAGRLPKPRRRSELGESPLSRREARQSPTSRSIPRTRTSSTPLSGISRESRGRSRAEASREASTSRLMGERTWKKLEKGLPRPPRPDRSQGRALAAGRRSMSSRSRGRGRSSARTIAARASTRSRATSASSREASTTPTSA